MVLYRYTATIMKSKSKAKIVAATDDAPKTTEDSQKGIHDDEGLHIVV